MSHATASASSACLGVLRNRVTIGRADWREVNRCCQSNPSLASTVERFLPIVAHCLPYRLRDATPTWIPAPTSHPNRQITVPSAQAADRLQRPNIPQVTTGISKWGIARMCRSGSRQDARSICRLPS